jgi:hypothetical protein
MTCCAPSCEGRGGEFCVSIACNASTGAGKTTPHANTGHGRLVELLPNRRVVEIDELEAENPALRGEMKITIELIDKRTGTELT